MSDPIETTTETTPSDAMATSCSEDEFIPILEERVRPVLAAGRVIVEAGPRPVGRRLLARLHEEAAELEDFLDDYGARHNRQFAVVTELVGAVRVFAAIATTLRHLMDRQGGIGAVRDPDDGEFARQTLATFKFSRSTLRNLLVALLRESESLGCGSPMTIGAVDDDFEEALPPRKLPRNLGAEECGKVEDQIAAVAALYIGAVDALLARSERKKFSDAEAMRRFVLDVADEDQCRFLEAKVHNLLGRYDAYVKNSLPEREDPRLETLRSSLATTLDLLHAMTLLVHFYEAHEDSGRSVRAREIVTRIVDSRQVLDRALNFCLYYVHVFLENGLPAAKDLLAGFTSQRTVELELPDGCLIHARPATLIVKIVHHHGTPVTMSMDGETANAGSITKVILLAGSHPKTRTVTFAGDRKPLRDLELLFQSRLGEDGLETLPPRLSYLRQ